MIVYKEVKFDAAHKLNNYEGACKNLHGHCICVQCWIKFNGKLDKSGISIDFVKLKEILTQFDHKYINDYIHDPTSENLAIYFLREIEKTFSCSAKIRVWESDTSYIEVESEDYENNR